jgi:hypothetical protein
VAAAHHPLRDDGIAALIHALSDMQMLQAGSETRRFGRRWGVTEPAGNTGVFAASAAPTIRALLFKPGRLRRDGFEAAQAH